MVTIVVVWSSVPVRLVFDGLWQWLPLGPSRVGAWLGFLIGISHGGDESSLDLISSFGFGSH